MQGRTERIGIRNLELPAETDRLHRETAAFLGTTVEDAVGRLVLRAGEDAASCKSSLAHHPADPLTLVVDELPAAAHALPRGTDAANRHRTKIIAEDSTLGEVPAELPQFFRLAEMQAVRDALRRDIGLDIERVPYLAPEHVVAAGVRTEDVHQDGTVHLVGVCPDAPSVAALLIELEFTAVHDRSPPQVESDCATRYAGNTGSPLGHPAA